MASEFVHLHVHTEYSLLDGLSKIKKLLNYVLENGMDALAITDHGAMYGAIDFYKEAKKQEIKPIIGLEAYTTTGDHKSRGERGKSKNNHLLLLAKNEIGYKNLMKLTTIAHLEGYYYRPRFSRELLEKYSEGIICTSACPQGEIGQALINDSYEEAKKIAKWFYRVFNDDYYLEVQRHNYANFVEGIGEAAIKRDILEISENEKKINEGVIKLSRELGIPIVATNDAHYIEPADAQAQDALLCIATGKQVSDIERLRFIDTPCYYITTPSEMKELFFDLPDAIDNTVKIAEKCNLEISTFGKWFFPKFSLPDDMNAEEYLEKLVFERLPKRIEHVTKEVRERAEHELGIINAKGYAPYFLIVMDIANWCRENGVVSTTRGSAAGSLVSYVIGITTVNPLTYYLPFERFLNPFRPSPPDIDLDVADNRREDVIGYITNKYGKQSVAQICTFGRMLSRGSVRDVARVLGYPYATGDKIAKLLPLPKQGFPVTIPKALAETRELKEEYDNNSDAKKILDLAEQIEGNARHISVHAAAVVVSPTDLTNFAPLQREPSGEKVITQYEMHACEDVGLIKIDILGITNLSILGSAIDMVEKTRGKRVDILDIPLDDKRTFKMLGRGETMGVFQLGSAGMTRYLKELKPARVEDLMAMVALYRPGPMQVIPEYIKRKKNPKLVKYLDPRMEKFLDASYGLVVYQDDLLFCALDLAGYNWEEADKFRKAVGKKIPEEMAAQKEKLTKGLIEKGQTEKFAEDLWKLFEPFQAYGFNKAHAASYGMVAYQTAYMKANYPVEYMTSLLSAESGDSDKVSAGINECRRMGIKVLPPHINKSDVDFTIETQSDSLDGRAIRFGLNAIKHVGKAAMEAILEARSEGEFLNFADFISKVDNRRVNKKVLESLIKVGAMGEYGKRAALLASIDEIRNKVARPKADNGQQGLFSAGEVKKASEGVAIRSDLDEFDNEELVNLERELLGFSLSAKPVSELISDYETMITHKINEINTEEGEGLNVTLAGVVNSVRVVVTKKTGAQMAFARIEDGTGTINLVVFPKLFSDVRDLLTINSPVLIEGKLDTREQTPSILVDTIKRPGSFKGEDQRLFIKLPGDTSLLKLKSLKDLLLENRGDQPVTLIFEDENERRVDLPISVNWTRDLADMISALINSPELS